MPRQFRIFSVSVCVAVCCLLVACAVQVSPGGGGAGPSIAFTIGGRTFTFTLGQSGVVEARSDSIVTQAFAPEGGLFQEPPATAPSSGRMTLLGSSVAARPSGALKELGRSQALPLNGTATVRFSIASGESLDLCQSATLLAEYDLILTTGVAAITNEVFDLSSQALSIIATNNVTICLEVTANFDGTLILDDFSFSFDGGAGGSGDAGTGSFAFTNNDIENIHVLLPGEDFEAFNRITPGNSRNTTHDIQIGDPIQLRAGRNGTVLGMVDCPVVTGLDYSATAVWTGSAITCTAEQSDTGDGGSGVLPGETIQVPIDNIGGTAVAVPPSDPEDVDFELGVIDDYAIVGVLEGNTPDVPPAASPSTISIDLPSLGLETVDKLLMAVHSSFVPDLPNGVTLATLTCEYEEGGPPTTQVYTLGSTTAEWSYTRAEHDAFIPGGVPHDFITILYTFLTTIDSASEYEGWVYSAELDLDSSRTLSSMTLTAASPASFPERPLVPNPTWAATALSAITLEGPASASGATGGSGTVTGQVVNAQSGDPLVGAAVRVLETGQSTTTDASGNFALSDVSAGARTLSASLAGFVDASSSIIILAGATTERTIGMLEIGAGGDNVAVVLNWGQSPSDLDLHMSGPDGSGGRFHVYFSDRTPVGHACLDLDDTSSFGPETITLGAGGNFVAGDYHVWIDNFSGTPEFDVSQATVAITAAGAQISDYSIGSASGSTADDIWQVVNFTVEADGSVSALNVVQTLTTGGSSDVF